MALKSFDPKQVYITVGGTLIKGFGDDMISVDRDNPLWELTVGCDGEATRVKSNDASATISITLQSTSPSNDYLTGIARDDETSNAGLVPFDLKDNMGTTTFKAVTCYIEKIPETSYGKSVSDRVWVLKTDNLVAFLGGNNAPVS